ncbi:MAG: hypothetical protein M1834_008809 [Cirrosporium novae-zelandiae]|nr:MAG: hypothetical protein M1834_008809 [Cirrosporium novae-zelandiae]
MVDHSHQTIALTILLVLPICSSIALGLRLLGKKLQKRFGVVIKYDYIGYHNKDIPADWSEKDYPEAMKYNYGFQITHNPILSLVKLSALIFLDKINGNQHIKIKYTIRGTFLVLAVVSTILLLCSVFQCSPVSYVYEFMLPRKKGHCLNQAVFNTFVGIFALLTDLAVLVIPAWITYSLHMPLRQKIAVTGLLSLGIMYVSSPPRNLNLLPKSVTSSSVMIIGCIRMKTLIHFYFQTAASDGNWDISFIWSAVEVDIAIITACGPSLKPLLQRFVPRLLGSSYRSSQTPGRGGNSQTYGRSRTTKSGTMHKTRRSGTMMDYEMGKYAGKKLNSVVTARGDGDSEEGIISEDGIMKTTSVNVKFQSSEESSMDGRVVPAIGEERIESAGKAGKKGRGDSTDSLV